MECLNPVLSNESVRILRVDEKLGLEYAESWRVVRLADGLDGSRDAFAASHIVVEGQHN